MLFGQEFVSWSWLTLMGLAWFPHFQVGWLMAVNDLPAIWQKERTSILHAWPAYYLQHFLTWSHLHLCSASLWDAVPINFWYIHVTSSLLAPHLRSCWVHTRLIQWASWQAPVLWRCRFDVWRVTQRWCCRFEVVQVHVLFRLVSVSGAANGESRGAVRWTSMNVGFSHIQPAVFDFGGFFWRNPWRLQAAVVPCPCRARPL